MSPGKTSATATGIELPPAAQKYLLDIRSSWKLKLYFLKNLPSALWWGIRVKSATPESSEVTLPFSWRTQNPFRSIYFAAQCGAGELATGILANMARLGRGNISMLVLDQKAEFVKKADTLTTFTCHQGRAVFETVQKAIATGEPQIITMTATGANASGEVVSRIFITWTFKVRSEK